MSREMIVLHAAPRNMARARRCAGNGAFVTALDFLPQLQPNNLMKTQNPPFVRSRGRFGPGKTLLLLAALLPLAGSAPAATIGVHFLRGAGGDVTGVQNAVANSLTPADLAGAAVYAQTNWNNLGVRGTNIVVLDSYGSPGVTLNWDAANAWSQSGGGTPAVQGTPDGNLMNDYLDSGGAANVAVTANLWGNNNANKPLVHVSGLSAWLATQGAAYYDLVIYSDGDNTGGRGGEFWTSDVNSDATTMTVGSDQVSHVFICDRANFVTTGTYGGVPATVQSTFSAQQGNFPGNYSVIYNLTADSFLLRTAEFNSRSVVNAIQIIPRTTVQPPEVHVEAPSQVVNGATAILRATSAAAHPFRVPTNPRRCRRCSRA